MYKTFRKVIGSVSGTIDDDTATVTVNGVNAVVSGNTFTAQNVTFNGGSNTITAVATDKAGNTATASITVILDTTPPQAVSTTPANDAIGVQTNAEIAVKFSEPIDPSTVSSSIFTLDGETGTVSATATYDEATYTAIFRPLSELVSNTTYTATLKYGVKDTLGNAITTDYTWSFKTSISSIKITITEPQEGATINKGQALVKGTFESKTADTGIRINGILAEINGNNWAAIVPLIADTNTIAADAVNMEGGTGAASITVNTESTDQPVKISANPQSGIAPLNASFTIDTGISNTVTSYKIDFEGDGVVDQETTDVSNITHSYETPGIYYPTVTATDSQYKTYTETTMVNVLDKGQMDALLKGKWDGMKEKLSAGNIEGAIEYLSDSVKDKYYRVFVDLKDNLPSILSTFEDISMETINGDIAEYVTLRNHEDGRYMYFIYFMRDKNGIWRINSM